MWEEEVLLDAHLLAVDARPTPPSARRVTTLDHEAVDSGGTQRKCAKAATSESMFLALLMRLQTTLDSHPVERRAIIVPPLSQLEEVFTGLGRVLPVELKGDEALRRLEGDPSDGPVGSHGGEDETGG